MRLNRTTVSLALMLSPYLLGTFIFVAIPALLAVALSFTRFDGLTTPIWVGLGNYTYLPTYPHFVYAARNTILFIIVAVPLRVIAMLGVSLLLNQMRRGTRFYRMAVFLPSVIPDMAYALMWAWIFNPLYGPINVILQGLGLPAPLWMADRNTVGWVVLFISLFQIGEGIVVLLAGLHTIPNEYFQAAEVDGGSASQRFRYITLPLLMPWLLVLTFRDIVFGAQAIFTPALIMLGPTGYFTHWFLPQMMYEETFSRLRMGVGSAVMVTWMLVAGVFFLLVYRTARGWGYSDEV